MVVRVGTCAWADHEDFYPRSVKPEERLAFYARYFSVVEVDSTYYRIPAPRTVEHWAEITPDGFVFDVKAHRTLTFHDRGRVDEDTRCRDAALFEAAVAPLAAAGKLGLLVFQYPPWFVASEANQRRVESMRERYRDFVVAVEFRNRSWWQGPRADASERWLRSLGLVNVVCDEPQAGFGSIPFVPAVTNRLGVVFRLHGRNESTWYQKGLTSSAQRFDYLYTPQELQAFVPVVQRFADEASEVHILMNNNQGDYAVRNALDWTRLLSLPVPGDVTDLPGQQIRLF
ncbi:DUF72 domain-containing protein [Alicyclobacillus cycloheptanicus]|uniref:Uncharacterized protein YecE (DUF72 family) n=1 Tax=Alicyclobacillus cycloheptanicus TaxID=1457 RepID=A0ABT9XDF3_9BACL|nr:DUF72 domain-containing protein [Alicyclobacillus cycloheptanicus]MDQ0188222.1 uncharacterized protein YecE (DUF72 family) [Alicyclobacillus cycloheptanicus]WDM00951.1 DUF72 domain-containing protein [Alicyclobacillus cycloheptanicus]